MKKYLVFFRLNGSLEVRSINSSTAGKALTFVANAYSNRLHATCREEIQDVETLYAVEEPIDWSKLYIVSLGGIYYSVDANYHLTIVDPRLINKEYEML